MVDLSSLTERQAARRQRVLVATVELAAEGGYDAVQMRDVAARAEVALGTIYHYFSSKDHLLAATMLDWTERLEAQIQRRPAAGATTEARVLDLLTRMTRGMSRAPEVSAALVTGFIAPEPNNAGIQQGLHDVWSRVMATAFPAGYDPVRRDQVTRTLEHVWFAGLVGWVNGWMTMDRAVGELEAAARLLLAGN